MKGFVVHGIPCYRPMAETVQDVKKTGMRGIVGARWLLRGNRRAGRTTSSVVLFLSSPVYFLAQNGQTGMRIRGR